MIPKNKYQQKGQSLVEIALFLPILLVILAGVVEVSQLVVTKNRVVEASRSAARFGANGGEDSAIATVALNSITDTLKINDQQWDIWAVRGTINQNGNGLVPNTWVFSHEYGVGATQMFSDVVEADVQALVLEQLQTNAAGGTDMAAAGGLRFVGAYLIHDVESILGLDAIESLADIHSIQELSVMRVIGVSRVATNGCDAFPIAIFEGSRSLTAPGTGSGAYPDAGDFHSSSSKPEYDDFVYHNSDQPLSIATEGDLFKITAANESGNMGWLNWNEGLNSDVGNLIASLTWPGNSMDYADCSSGGCTGAGIAGERFWGFAEPNDSSDRTMHEGDNVWAFAGSPDANLRSMINQHINLGRTLRLIVWDTVDTTGGNTTFHISGFAIFRLHGHNITNGADSFILGEFIRLDTSCGQPE